MYRRLQPNSVEEDATETSLIDRALLYVYAFFQLSHSVEAYRGMKSDAESHVNSEILFKLELTNLPPPSD